MALFTIGYEGLTLDVFLDVLHIQGIQTIFDVRDMPLSRKPGFSKTPLTIALAENGIKYVHAKTFGTPKPIRNALKSTGDWAAYENSYLKFLAPQETELSMILTFENACLLCFEANPLECHRSLIARRMLELGLIDQIKHLQPLTQKAIPSLVPA